MISPDNPTFEEKLTLNTHNGAQYERLKQSSIPSHLRLALLLPCVVIEEQVIEGIQLLLQLVQPLEAPAAFLKSATWSITWREGGMRVTSLLGL